MFLSKLSKTGIDISVCCHWGVAPLALGIREVLTSPFLFHLIFVNSLRPRRNGRYNADDIFKCIFSEFLKENVWIPTKISLKFVPKGPINNIPALVQIMAWRRPSDKPLSEPMMVSLLTHICVTRPQWAKISTDEYLFDKRDVQTNNMISSES